MIQGIFYARFFPQEGETTIITITIAIILMQIFILFMINSMIKRHILFSVVQTDISRLGTKIVAQSPPGCIVPTGTTTEDSNSSFRSTKPCLFDFDVLQEYIIPRKAFFNRYIAVNDPDSKYTVLGFPVAIANPKYQRNEFIFNFGLVVERDVDQIPYERVVRRLAVTFAEMEKQNEYLSRDAGQGDECEAGRRPIESLLEIIKEDLNNYGECMIPVGEYLGTKIFHSLLFLFLLLSPSYL